MLILKELKSLKLFPFHFMEFVRPNFLNFRSFSVWLLIFSKIFFKKYLIYLIQIAITVKQIQLRSYKSPFSFHLLLNWITKLLYLLIFLFLLTLAALYFDNAALYTPANIYLHNLKSAICPGWTWSKLPRKY